LGAFNVQINDLNSINYIDLKLLSSPSGMYAYQKVLKTYKGLKGSLNQNDLISKYIYENKLVFSG
jgi:hypothetical protein